MNRIKSALKEYQAKAANQHPTDPVSSSAVVKEHPIVPADNKSVELASEPQDTGVAQSVISGQRQAGLVGPQSMSQVLVLNKEGDLDRHLCPTASHEDLTPRSRIEDSILKEVDSENYQINAKSKEDERKDLALSQEGDLDRPLFPPAIHESATKARKILGQLLAEQIEDSILMKMDAGSHQIDEEQKEEQPISVIDTSHKLSKVGAQSSEGTKTSVRAADTKVGSSVDVFHLFQTFEDFSSEYKMPKIQLIEDQYFKFINSLVQPETQVVGVYGCFQRALEFIRCQFKCKVPDQFQQIKEGIILFKKQENQHQQVFAVYKCPDPEKFYTYTNGTDQASLASTYLRYLVDVCQEIVILPPKGMLPNPDSSNPFKRNDRYGVKYTYKENKPEQNCKITEIPQVTDKNLQMNLREVVCSADQSIYLSAVIMNRQEHNNKLLIQCKREILGSNLDSTNSYFSYEEIKKIIIESWPSKPHKFHDQENKLQEQKCFKKNMIQLLSKFIPNENQQSFQAICEQFEQEYISKSIVVKAVMKEQKEIIASQLIESYVNNLNKNSCENFQKRLNESQQQQWQVVRQFGNVYNKAKEKFGYDDHVCSEKCRSFYRVVEQAVKDLIKRSTKKDKEDIFKISSLALKSYLGQKDFKVHHSIGSNTQSIQHQTTFLLQLLTQKNNNLKVQKQRDMGQIRFEILLEFFEKIESLVQQVVQSFTNSVSITFQQIKIIRDNDKIILGWNISKQTNQLQHQFAKNFTEEIKTKNVIFITEKSGLIHFDNCPNTKSSIYHFNFTSRTLSTIILNHVTNQGAKLLTDPHNLQWCIISDQEKRVDIGRLKQDGQIEGGVPVTIYDQESEGLKVQSIQSACFLPMGDRLLFLNQDGNIFEYKWQSNTLQAILKKKNEGGSGVVKMKIRPDSIEDSYCEIQASTDGKNIILRSQKSIDVYDLNWDVCFQLPIQEDFLSLKTFSDSINNFLIVLTKLRSICFQLVGLTSKKILNEQKVGNFQNRSNLGNPIFDHLYHSFKKFGSQSTFIGSPGSNNLHLISDKMERNQAQNLIKYFKSLELTDVRIDEQRSIDALNLFSNSAIDSEHLKMILLGRVAIHLATIENSQLIPLRDGLNISDTLAEKMQNKDDELDIIQPLTSIIKFGVYDKFLKDLKRDVKVVSIVGKQSSGKSYVMNRFFGTRFNVSATRCTDGIWMSIVEIDQSGETQQIDKGGESQLFIIFDCEGLFSARRNKQEEIKLCLALSAISDILIVNRDKSFDRHLDSLFKSFSKIKGQIKGNQLFRGTLMSLIRDVEIDEQQDTYRESNSYFQTANGKNQGFIDEVFSGESLVQCMSHFGKLQDFQADVEHIRKTYFLALDKPHWISGRDFAESLKITLSQIYIEDDADINIHKIKIKCDRLFEEALQMFYNGGDRFRGEQSILKFSFNIEDEQFAIEVLQSSIKLNKEVNSVDGKEEMSLKSEEVIEQFTSQSRIYGTNIHNEWVSSFGLYLKELLEQRTAFILSYLTQELPKDEDFKEIINSTKFKLKNQFQIYSQKIQYCDQACRKCKRLCTKQLYHRKDCDCETDHICQAQCTIDESCINGKFLCADIYGHQNDHKCNNGNHKCSLICEIPDCGLICSAASGHSEYDGHNCGNKHLCDHKCEDNHCTRICMFDQSYPHQRHHCGEKNCIHKCDLCERQCIFPDHFHNKSIAEGNNAGLVFTSPDGKSYPMNYHICDQEHECKSNCTADGICSVGYDQEEKIWKSPASPEGFPYKLFIPREKTKVCQIMINKYNKSHDKDHNCKVVDGHRCGEQCPECKSYCQKDFGHPGHHHTNAHRNKENNIFVSATETSTISIMHEGKMRVYNVGETCKPENCTISCARKGRAHYHIKECKGKEKCDAKTNSKIQHATEKFQPYPTKIYDKWLCQSYWNSFNWDPPIDGEQLEEALSCNYMCTHHDHKDKISFCIKSALHSDQHKFNCKHEDSCLSNVIDIVFCCDSTGSMGSYIEKSKDTCKKIINDFKTLPNPQNRTIKFGFYAYRDHPPNASYVVKGQPLTDEPNLQKFLETVDADEGGGYPAAAMDGLDQSIKNAGWRDKSMRYIFHIADAPCYGRQFGGDRKQQGQRQQYGGQIQDLKPDSPLSSLIKKILMRDERNYRLPESCPRKITIEELAKAMKDKNIRYKLLKIGTSLNIMASEFKKFIEGYEECDLDSAEWLEFAVTKILVRDVEQKELDVIKN